MDGVVVTTTKKGLTLEIPWEVLRGVIAVGKEEELTEEEALRIFEEGEREYREGKTVPFSSIRELLAKS